MKDFQSVFKAVTQKKTDVFIPEGHALYPIEEREWFQKGVFAFSEKVHKPEVLALEPVDDPNFADAMFAKEPMAVLAFHWLRPALNSIQQGLNGDPDIELAQACDQCLQQDWIPAILERLADMSRQTIALEFNILMMTGEAIDFDSYLEKLRAPAARNALLAEYPVLADRLKAVAAQQAGVVGEFVERLCKDAADLRDLFGDSQTPVLPTRFHFSEGDTHNNGHAVIIVECTDGKRLVYKPRYLEIEVAFVELLNIINRDEKTPNFKVSQFLCRENYGWAEFIAASPCQSKEECRAFYTRVGGLLSIVHLLGGFDLHNENIIASGPDPVLIDLETLFHSFKNGSYLGRGDPFLKAAEYPAVEALLTSVMTTLMLPQNSRDENVSGLSGQSRAGQVARRYSFERNQIDYVEVGQKEFFHRPQLNGEAVEPGEYTAEIQSGFESVYRYFMHNRASWSSPDGPLCKMQNAPARIVLRDTQIYTNLIEQSYHPTLLQDPAARWMHFLNLWMHAKGTPTTVPLVPEEVQQMYHDDVPYFWHRPIGTSVYAMDGQPTGYIFDESGFDCYLQRLADLSEKDLSIQKWIIAGAIETDVAGKKTRLTNRDPAPVSKEELRKALAITHDEIIKVAFENDKMLDWLTVTPTPDQTLALGPLDVTLYNGIAGLALYFAWYAKFTKDKKAAQHLDKVLCNLRTQVETDWDSFELSGAMNGLGGVAYVYGHIAVLLEDPSYFDEAEHILQRSLELQQADLGFFDLIGGSAGLILVAISLYESSARPAFLQLAEKFKDALLSSVREDEQGAYWASVDDEHPLTGLSHGYSGIALALAALNLHAPDTEQQEMITHLLKREARDFIPSQNNWLDWRYVNLKQATEDDAHFQHFWCNGSAGIGLVRIRLHEMGWTTPDILDDLNAATTSVFDHGLRLNHSLCHGDFGNLDFLRMAAQITKKPGLEKMISISLGESCRDIIEGDIFGGASRRVAPPDLMTGLSGVAWGILRQLAPDDMPDVLSLKGARNIIS